MGMGSTMGMESTMHMGSMMGMGSTIGMGPTVGMGVTMGMLPTMGMGSTLGIGSTMDMGSNKGMRFTIDQGYARLHKGTIERLDEKTGIAVSSRPVKTGWLYLITNWNRTIFRLTSLFEHNSSSHVE